MLDEIKPVKVQLEFTLDQAVAAVIGLDVYTRLCIGQIDIVEQLVRDGTIPIRSETAERQTADIDTCEIIRQIMDSAKNRLGHPAGGSMGIGNKHVHITGHRAWELRKVLAKVIAEHKHKPGNMRGVDHEGLIVRYTTDPAPRAKLTRPSASDGDMAQRAFEIADESMTELVRSHAIRILGNQLYALVDENSVEVTSLAKADPAIQEAFQWLSVRGLAELVAYGKYKEDVILLKEDF